MNDEMDAIQVDPRTAELAAGVTRREPPPRVVSEELVQRLRNIGVDPETVAFADSFVTRYDQHDLDRAYRNGFLVAIVVVVLGLVCVGVILGALA